VKYPTLKKVEINDMPIYTFSVAGPYSSEIIYEKIKDLESNLKAVPGAGDILVSGKPTKEIRMMFSLQKLAELEIDVSTIINQLK
jgi:multidrug efflux pump subunit AcrB